MPPQRLVFKQGRLQGTKGQGMECCKEEMEQALALAKLASKLALDSQIGWRPTVRFRQQAWQVDSIFSQRAWQFGSNFSQLSLILIRAVVRVL
jgi:hypothetical protein